MLWRKSLAVVAMAVGLSSCAALSPNPDGDDDGPLSIESLSSSSVRIEHKGRGHGPAVGRLAPELPEDEPEGVDDALPPVARRERDAPRRGEQARDRGDPPAWVRGGGPRHPAASCLTPPGRDKVTRRVGQHRSCRYQRRVRAWAGWLTSGHW